MSDEVEIRSGGVIAVDTRSLAPVAAQLLGLAGVLDEVAFLVRHAIGLRAAAGAWSGDFAGAGAALAGVGALARRAETAADSARALAARLRDAIAVYELAEAHVARAAASAAGDAATVARLDRRTDELAAAHPGTLLLARGAMHEWEDEADAELFRQLLRTAPVLWAVAPFLALVMGTGTAVFGRQRELIPVGAPVSGSSAPVPLQVLRTAPASAPATLAELAERVPGGSARLRVERFAMPDGSLRFAVYVAGTRAWSGLEPWDMTSNVQLYLGERSDSYDTVVAGLRDAGARRGDVVYAVGHSQGAMIVDRLAAEGGYDTRMLVTFGSPVEALPGDATTSVQVRHRDDAVTMLAGHRNALAVGAEGSFVAERTVAATSGLGELLASGHAMSEYAETARLVDASQDPRVVRLRGMLAELAGASGTLVEYAPREVSRAGGGEG